MNYITRHPQGIILNQQKEVVLPKGLVQTINEMAMQNGSTLTGRIQSAKYLLQLSQIPPIYIDPECTLIQTHSIRNPHCIFIKEQSILYTEAIHQHTMVYFRDGNQLLVARPYTIIRKQIEHAQKLMEILHCDR